MTDDADRADLYIQQMLDSALNRINPKQSQEFGECMDCGEAGRLIDSVCVPCTKLHEIRQKNWRNRDR